MTFDGCHLTQDEVDELLMGVAQPELLTHFAQCEPCRVRVAGFAASIQPFNRVSLAWSEARSHTFSRDLSRHTPAWLLSSSNLRSVVATLILGVIGSLMVGSHQRFNAFTEAVTQPGPRVFAVDAHAQQIARDNAMLQAIDAELTEPESTPAALFRVEDRTAAQPAAGQDRD